MGQTVQTLLEREKRGTCSSFKRRNETPGEPIYIHLAPTLLGLAVSKALITAPECQQEFMAQHPAHIPSARLHLSKYAALSTRDSSLTSEAQINKHKRIRVKLECNKG